MCVRRRGKVYWVDFSFNRKRYRKPSPDNSYRGAQAYELLIRQKLARGEPFEEEIETKPISFGEVAIQWLESYVRNNNKQSEYINRRYILKSTLIPFFGKKLVCEIKSFDIEMYKTYLLRQRGVSPKTVNNYLCILSRCLKSALEWQMIEIMPKIKLMKVPPQKYDFLTDEEARVLIRHAGGYWRDMILLAIRTGLRFGEIIALKWEDINLKERTLTVSRNIVRGIEGSPKNNKTRIVPLTASVLAMLNERPREYERVFYFRKGQPLKHDFCRDNLHAICKQAGLRKIGWHQLRHSFASHLAARRNSIIAIKELLGHSDIKTTMRYAHVNLPVLQGAIDTLEPSFQENVTIMSQSQIRDFGSETYPALQLFNSIRKNKKLDEDPVS